MVFTFNSSFNFSFSDEIWKAVNPRATMPTPIIIDNISARLIFMPFQYLRENELCYLLIVQDQHVFFLAFFNLIKIKMKKYLVDKNKNREKISAPFFYGGY